MPQLRVDLEILAMLYFSEFDYFSNFTAFWWIDFMLLIFMCPNNLKQISVIKYTKKKKRKERKRKLPVF